MEIRLSTYPANAILYAPSHDEKTFALLAHVLGIFSGFIAPLVFFLVKRDSKFVSFHALQSLAWHIIYFALFFGGMSAEDMAAALGRTVPSINHSLRTGEVWLRREMRQRA